MHTPSALPGHAYWVFITKVNVLTIIVTKPGWHGSKVCRVQVTHAILFYVLVMEVVTQFFRRDSKHTPRTCREAETAH